MHRVVMSLVAASLTLGITTGGLPLTGSEGMTTAGTGSTGCCRR